MPLSFFIGTWCIVFYSYFTIFCEQKGQNTLSFTHKMCSFHFKFQDSSIHIRIWCFLFGSNSPILEKTESCMEVRLNIPRDKFKITNTAVGKFVRWFAASLAVSPFSIFCKSHFYPVTRKRFGIGRIGDGSCSHFPSLRIVNTLTCKLARFALGSSFPAPNTA